MDALKKIIHSIDKKEKKFILIICLFVIIITSSSSLYGYLNRGPNQNYLGIQSINAWDHFVYYSYLEQVKEGHLLFKDLYTGEGQKRILFNPFWLGAGLLGKIFSFSNVLTFQLSRILLIPLFIFIIYLFVSYFFQNKQKRKLGLVFILFSSGLGGWIGPSLLIKHNLSEFARNGYLNLPTDLWVAESNTFLTLYHTPHFIASLLLILLIFLLMLLAFESNKFKYSLLAGLAGLILFFFHPYHLPTIFGVLGVYLLVIFLKNKKINLGALKHFLILFFISLPAVIYHLLLLNYDPLSQQRALQNVCLTPGLWTVITGYGFLFIFALIGIGIIIKNKFLNLHSSSPIKTDKSFNNKYIFIIVWPIVQFLIIYFPINFQRRFIEGLHIPLAILTTIALLYLYKKIKDKGMIKYWVTDNKLLEKFLFLTLFVLLFALTNMNIIFQDIRFYHNRGAPFYTSKNKMMAIEWLQKNISDENLVLAGRLSSGLIPVFSGKTVYYGHWGETALFASKEEWAKWFFKENTEDEKRIEFLKKEGITIIFFSQEEKELGNFNPEEKNYLKKVYENDEVKIYLVIF